MRNFVEFALLCLLCVVGTTFRLMPKAQLCPCVVTHRAYELELRLCLLERRLRIERPVDQH